MAKLNLLLGVGACVLLVILLPGAIRRSKLQRNESFSLITFTPPNIDGVKSESKQEGQKYVTKLCSALGDSNSRSGNHLADYQQIKNYLKFDLEYWENRTVHQKVLADKNFKPLTANQAQGVEKLLFFTGYPRSGHSIVGSLLDAHPSIILSYGFYLFRGLLTPLGKKGSIEGLLQNKTLFFNAMYERSYQYSLVSEDKASKGYTLDVPGLWSGQFKGDLKIIGDKSASSASKAYWLYSNSLFKQRHEHLAECMGIDFVTIHVVRNPFDMIATHTLYDKFKTSWKNKKKRGTHLVDTKLNDSDLLLENTEFFFRGAEAVKRMVPLCGMKVIEVHSEDIVRSPRKELQRLSHFLEVDFSEKYLQTCEDKIFKNVSRTRDRVVWPAAVRADVERRIQKFSFFRGYTFEQDFYNPP